MNRVIHTIFMIFVGCCSNVIFLELIVKPHPGSGNIITFAQFLFIALEGLVHYYKFGTAKRKVPIRIWSILVVMFFLVSVINNYALNFNIPMPLHMIFRSGSLIASLILGWLVLKRRYKARQIFSVILITIGIIMATLASSKSMKKLNADEPASDYVRWTIGISMLVFALVVSAMMGICQEKIYSTYGKHPEEALFYTHLLSLPFFGFFAKDTYHHVQLFNNSNWLPIFSNVGVPVMWIYLICNMFTQYFCIRSVYILTTECSSLVVTLVITLRKFVSLIISIVYFQNDFTIYHTIGTICVFLGTFLFSNIDQDIIRYLRRTNNNHEHSE